MRTKMKQRVSMLMILMMIVQWGGGLGFGFDQVKAQSSDGDPPNEYYIDVPLTGADFSDPASFRMKLKETSDDTEPMHTFFVDKGTPSADGFTTAHMTTVTENVYEGGGSLYFGDGITGPLNLNYKVDGLQVGATYELTVMMKKVSGVPVGGGSLSVKNYDTSNFTSAGDSVSVPFNTLTEEWLPYTLSFVTAYPHAKINFWGSANKTQVLVGKMQLKQVSDTEPQPPTEPEPPAVLSVNNGHFEAGADMVSSDQAVKNQFFSKNNNYELTDAEKYTGNLPCFSTRILHGRRPSAMRKRI